MAVNKTIATTDKMKGFFDYEPKKAGCGSKSTIIQGI
jgi:hypothetical protein